MYLRENPWHNRRRTGKEEWERRAIEQVMVAVNSVLRDWIKGQVTAVEAGLVALCSLTTARRYPSASAGIRC